MYLSASVGIAVYTLQKNLPRDFYSNAYFIKPPFRILQFRNFRIHVAALQEL
jgi:hypothetical protein